ncbi:YdcF family protein [Clostridium sp.]|uniref:YdcF family protein n=1 Tax=Clostridium sp. TaxID=1506 RepID=UPI002FCA18B9
MGYPFDCISDLVFVKTDIQTADIILVPGGSHPQLMEKAAELYKLGLAPYILPSGSVNPKIPEYSSEWEFLKSIGVKLGVPEERILKENQATHTFENAEFSWRVIKENKIPVKKAILVCKAYHSRRALLTYQSVFPKDIEIFVVYVSDKKEIRKDNWFLDEEKIKIVMGEVVKIGKYFEPYIKKFQDEKSSSIED